jgi:hypothetical protein
MATAMKYNLAQFNEISENNFHYEMPENVFININKLCTQMDIPVLTSRLYVKPVVAKPQLIQQPSRPQTNHSDGNKKRKGNKHMEVSAEEWDNLWKFKSTKIEKKEGLDDEIDQVRSIINKISEKTFFESREKMMAKLDALTSNCSAEELNKLGTVIYDLMSTNKINSRLFSELFAELVTKFSWMMHIFMDKYSNVMDMYMNIEYVDADKDYDGFCEMNKKNEKRKSITKFYHNLAVCGLLKNDENIIILNRLLEMILAMISLTNKKNEVDELTENVALLFDKEMLEKKDREDIIEMINNLSNMKSKDYPSLSNKAVFKFMDMNEM